MKAISIRFSDELHKAIKYKLIESDESIQQYVIRLIKSDLNYDDSNEEPSDYLPQK